MTPEKLDRFLRTVTHHEKLYQKGWTNPKSIGDLKTVTIHGEEVKVLRLTDKIPALSGGRHSRYQAYPIHIHPWVELNYMYSGSCTQKINGNPVTLKQGQVLLLEQKTIHEVPVLGDDDILLNIYIQKDYLTTAFFNRISEKNIVSQFLINAVSSNLSHDNYIFFPSEKSRRLPLFIQEFFCEFYEPSACSQDVMNSLFTLILTELIAVCHSDNAAALQTASTASASILPILKYIETHHKTASLKETADFFGMHPDYLSRVLKQKTGCSFQTLLTRQRMLAAQFMLTNSSLPVTEIAHQVGYHNITFFYKKFQDTYGYSPGVLRS